MARTLIEPQLQALSPPAAGDLADTALPELLFAHAAAGSTGTLRLTDERGEPLAALRLEAGALVGATVDGADAGLLPSVIPLCARDSGRFAFKHVPDDLGSGPRVVRGKLDVLAVIAAAMRGPVREDAIDAALISLGDAPLWRNPRIAIERYGFGPQELAFVRQVDGAALTVSELLADPPCLPHVARRVLYVLAISRALSAPPRGERQVSGMIARHTPPPLPRSSRPPQRTDATVVFEAVPPRTPSVRPPRARASLAPPVESMRAPRSRTSQAPPAEPSARPPRARTSTPAAPSARPARARKSAAPPAARTDGSGRTEGRYHVQRGAVERVVGAEPRGGAPRRALPSALAWRDELRERARLAPRQTAYEILGVEPDCEPPALHEAHASIASRFAPDSLPDTGEAAVRDAKVVLEHARRALDVLSDGVTRAEYDRASDAMGRAAPPARVFRGLHAEACFRRGESLWKRRDYAGAQHEVERALALDGTCARYEALLGLLLHLRSGSGEGGRVHPNAMRHLEQALRLDPRCEQANYAMALVLKRAGRHDEAFQHFQRVWRQNPNNLEAAREVRLHSMRNRKRPSSGLIDRLLGRGGKPDKR
jgi:curved DNA-binding protein CbpA